MPNSSLHYRSNIKLRHRGIASVLAMMFLVIFSSLAAVMAVVAQGNLRTADSFLKVTRATSAAEAGIVFARRRLYDTSRRFIVTKGEVDDDFGTKLWLGTYGGGDGTITVLPPDDYVENPPAVGLADGVMSAHAADQHNIEVDAGDALLPLIDEFGILRVKPIGGYLADGSLGIYFRLKYELLSDGRFVRVTSQGVDGDVKRTLQLDFRITKKIEYAVVSPNRIMIGKNVHIEGPLGSRYGIIAEELAPANGNPIVIKSDFYHLDNTLDTNLDTLHAALAVFDVDGDNRLRPEHPVEQGGITGALADVNGDEYIDDFDMFMLAFDLDADQRVVYDADLAFAAGLGVVVEEFTTDDQLGHLMDFANSDRNFDDVIDATDTALGYGDGVINTMDFYSKVNGALAFAAVKSDWEAARGGVSYQTFVEGPIRSEDPDAAAVMFEVSQNDLLDITTADFADAETWMQAKANAGAPFASQVADGIAAGGTFTAAAFWETVPWGAKGYYDWYERDVYENMEFRDTAIPVGTNGLFINCTFIGATYIQSHQNNLDPNWNYVGMMDRNPTTGVMEEKYVGLQADLGDGTMVGDTKDYSNNIRFHNCTFIGSVVSDATAEFAHVRNKVQFTGNTIFNLDDTILTQAEIDELSKSSIMMPGFSVDVGNFNNTLGERVELLGTIIAGVMDVRGSADVFGTLLMTFRPVEGAGPLFYGGTTDGFNTTIGYFGPSDGDSESVDPSELVDTDGDGIPDIGEDLDGDGINDPFEGFGEITVRYNPDANLPDGIPWPVLIRPEEGTYIEGGSM